MGEGAVIHVPADPTILYYLKVQSAILLGFGLFIGCGALIVVLFSKDGIKLYNLAWLLLGVAAAVASGWVVVRNATLETPALSLEGDVLRVGDAELGLDETTEINVSGDTSDLPRFDGKAGYSALPGMSDLPPSFAGGPVVTVSTQNGGSVSFKPLLYGSRFVPEPGPELRRLVDALLARGEAGNARRWLDSIAPPADVGPGATPDFGKFLLFYLIFGVPVLGFLLIAVGVGIKKKLAG